MIRYLLRLSFGPQLIGGQQDSITEVGRYLIQTCLGDQERTIVTMNEVKPSAIYGAPRISDDRV